MSNDLDMTKTEDEVLTRLKEGIFGVTEIYIAGGYLRDTLLGKPIKDIDVFLYASEQNIELMQCKSDFVKTSVEAYNSQMFHLTGNITGTRLNLIFPKYPWHKHFETFDIGLCKICYDVKQNILKQSPEFRRDVDNKTITLLPNPRPCQEHVDRVMRKYPDYRVINYVDIPF